MTALRGFQVAVVFSLAIHVAVGASVELPGTPTETQAPAPEPFILTAPPIPTPSVPKPEAIKTPKAKLPAPAPQTKPRQARVSAPKAGSSRYKSEADFALNAGQKKIYISYFAAIKKSIHNTLQKRYFQENAENGNVSLFFILRSSGELEQVLIRQNASRGDPALQKMAIECVREAAPFEPFPRELDSERIAFNVTLHFDEF